MQQKETDGTTKASPNGEETQNKDEPQNDKFNKQTGVEAVANEVIIRAPKPDVSGEKTNIDTLVSCYRFTCGHIVCIYLT